MHGTSGSFSRLITFKHYNGRTIVSNYPDMSRVVYTKAQIAERFRFKLAVAYARTVIADPLKRKAYSNKKHVSAYHVAISEYIRKSKAEERSLKTTIPEPEPSVSVEMVEPTIAVATNLAEGHPLVPDRTRTPS